MEKYCFGVDLGGTTVKIGLFNQKGDFLDRWEIITRKEENGKYILSDIALSIAEKMVHMDIPKGNVLGIGIGVPGPVTGESVVQGCVNLGWGLGRIDIGRTLTELTDLPCKVENDANVAALGEQWQGGGKGYKNCVMITLGTGVGGGIITDGRIIPGVGGAAGELGHMNIMAEEDIWGECGCGHRGCLEQAASATGVVNLAKVFMERYDDPSPIRDIEDLTSKDIFDAAKAGDVLAGRIADRMFMYLGKACAQIACVIDPEIFVIGGGVSRAGSYLIDGVAKYYREYAFHACKDTPFTLATLGNDAGMAGAAKLVCSI